MDLMDNSELEDLMKMDVETASRQDQDRFFEKLKESQLLMPVEYPENSDTFNIIYLTDAEGKNAVPLFTSYEMMGKAGVESSAYPIYMSDLADLMDQADEKYSLISINPFTDTNINMGLPAFVDLFDEDDEMSDVFSEMLQIILENSVELEEDTAIMIHSEDNFMKNLAVAGIYQDPMPMKLNSNPYYNEDLKYTNILLFEKSKKLLLLGEVINDEFDTVVAPATEFEFVQDLDEFTSVWRCGAQEFYDV